jgi:cob(I)alamin adenosyltransferase
MAERIYTRTGDAGDTGLFGDRRVRKDNIRVEAYGAVDELNSVLGVARSNLSDKNLGKLIGRIQSELLTVGADLATPLESGESHGRATVVRVTADTASALEPEIDLLESELPTLTRFILPGGSPGASHLHLARTVCRRAERQCVSLSAVELINPAVITYLNRLSDLLFVMARAANSREGVADVVWNG